MSDDPKRGAPSRPSVAGTGTGAAAMVGAAAFAPCDTARDPEAMAARLA